MDDNVSTSNEQTETRKLLVQAFGVAWLKNDLEQHQVLSMLWRQLQADEPLPLREAAVDEAMSGRCRL